MKIHFIKPFQYNPRSFADQSLFDAYNAVVNRRYDPPILNYEKYQSSDTTAFSSPSLRARQTAKVYVKQKPTITALLAEVSFDMSKLLTRLEFEQSGSTLVRQRFKRDFIANELGESHEILKKRIDDLLKLCKSTNCSTVFCFSHSFFIKLIEAYVLSNYLLFDDPKIIHNYLNSKQSTYPYGKGLTLKI